METTAFYQETNGDICLFQAQQEVGRAGAASGGAGWWSSLEKLPRPFWFIPSPMRGKETDHCRGNEIPPQARFINRHQWPRTTTLFPEKTQRLLQVQHPKLGTGAAERLTESRPGQQTAYLLGDSFSQICCTPMPVRAKDSLLSITREARASDTQ